MKVEGNVLTSINKNRDIKNGTCIISKKVDTIDCAVFKHCDKLKYIEIPDNVKVIMPGAFQDCYNLKDIILPDNIEKIEEDAFKNLSYDACNVFENGLYIGSKSNPYMVFVKVDDKYITEQNIHPDCRFILDRALHNCTEITEIEISDKVEFIGACSFSGCTKLKKIKLGENVKFIGYGAFSDCCSLENINLPEGLESIETITFKDCSSLKNVIIPESVKKIKFMAFRKCCKLNQIILSDNVEELGFNCFESCTNLRKVKLGKKITTIPNHCFCGCINLEDLEFGDDVISIQEDAFSLCRKLSKIKTKANVKIIESDSFYETKLSKIDPKYYYKAFRPNLICSYFQYKENEWFEHKGEVKFCHYGFHACKNLFHVFNYYSGELNKDIVIYKVELKGISDERQQDSKVVARKIKLVERLTDLKDLFVQE